MDDNEAENYAKQRLACKPCSSLPFMDGIQQIGEVGSVEVESLELL
jgi:hypothetical protein